jgi:hypothetical protein
MQSSVTASATLLTVVNFQDQYTHSIVAVKLAPILAQISAKLVELIRFQVGGTVAAHVRGRTSSSAGQIEALAVCLFLQSKIFVYARDASMFEFGPAGHSS